MTIISKILDCAMRSRQQVIPNSPTRWHCGNCGTVWDGNSVVFKGNVYDKRVQVKTEYCFGSTHQVFQETPSKWKNKKWPYCSVSKYRIILLCFLSFTNKNVNNQLKG